MWRSDEGASSRRRLRPASEGTDEVRYNLSALYDKYGEELQAFFAKEVNNPEFDKDRDANKVELDDAVKQLLKKEWRRAAKHSFRWEKRALWSLTAAGFGTMTTGFFKDATGGVPLWTGAGILMILGSAIGAAYVGLKVHGIISNQYAGGMFRRETIQPHAPDEKNTHAIAERNIQDILSGKRRPDNLKSVLHTLHALHAH